MTNNVGSATEDKIIHKALSGIPGLKILGNTKNPIINIGKNIAQYGIPKLVLENKIFDNIDDIKPKVPIPKNTVTAPPLSSSSVALILN